MVTLPFCVYSRYISSVCPHRHWSASSTMAAIQPLKWSIIILQCLHLCHELPRRVVVSRVVHDWTSYSYILSVTGDCFLNCYILSTLHLRLWIHKRRNGPIYNYLALKHLMMLIIIIAVIAATSCYLIYKRLDLCIIVSIYHSFILWLYDARVFVLTKWCQQYYVFVMS